MLVNQSIVLKHEINTNGYTPIVIEIDSEDLVVVEEFLAVF